MRKSFNNIISKLSEFSLLLEDALANLPNSAKNYKIKTKVDSAYKSLNRTIEIHESLITDVVPKLKVKTDGYTNEFIDIWNIYKDFMLEQFGIRMGSRMQIFRLQLLFDYSNNDFKLAASWLKYYMANGSSNIYPVNELKLKEEDGKSTTNKKAGFTLPTNITK